MRHEQIATWIQLITGLAMIGGLGLVVWQLQETRALTRAQLTSDSFAIRIQRRSGLLGENAASALGKACLEPESLTIGENRIAETYYHMQVDAIDRLKLLQERDGLYPEGYWQRVSADYYAEIFDSAHGRAWFMLNAHFQDASIVEAGYEALALFGGEWCEVRHKDMIEGAKIYRTESEEDKPDFIGPMKERIDQHLRRIPIIE
jgi:hypothetical protein